MKLRFPKINRNRLILLLIGVACTALNVVLLNVVADMGVPFYFDAVGTIFMAMVGGSFPAITVSVATNLICSQISPDSLYYGLIGVLIAMRTAKYTHETDKYKLKRIIILILDMAIISGFIGIICQYILLGAPHFNYVYDTARIVAGDNRQFFFLMSFVLLVGLNFVDKTISFVLSVFVYRLIPENIRTALQEIRWKQTPLTRAEVREIVANIKDDGTTFRTRVIILLMSVAFPLSVILAAVSANINHDYAMENGQETVDTVTDYASKLFDPVRLDKFMEYGRPAVNYGNVSYWNYNRTLMDLKDSFSDLEYLYIYKETDVGRRIILDTGNRFQKFGYIGELADARNYPGLFYGNYIRAASPIKSFDGKNTAFYIAAGISMEDYAVYIRNYVIKIILAFAGFFVLILAYGLWTSAYYLVYPIGSLEKKIEEFLARIDDQEKLDDSVRSLQKLDIRTNDELERLYRSVCEMAYGTAEQMRSIRILARSNEKMQTGLMITIADIVGNQDIDARSHVRRTTAYVHIILDGLKKKGYYSEKLTDKFVSDVEISAPLYDIGKIKIPDPLRNKHGKLSDEEFEIMKTHTTAGKQIIENAISTVEGESSLKEALNMATYHHENWDGTGYPMGLHGEVIPLSARVMAVADYFEELTSMREYKETSSWQEALDEITEGAGTRFDPKCVEAFADSFTEVKKVLRKYPERG